MARLGCVRSGYAWCGLVRRGWEVIGRAWNGITFKRELTGKERVGDAMRCEA